MTDYAATVPPRFMAELDVRYLGWRDGRPLFRLLEPFTYFSRIAQRGYTVPAGYEFIPRSSRAAWRIVSTARRWGSKGWRRRSATPCMPGSGSAPYRWIRRFL